MRTYSVAEAAKVAGISPKLLRVWEERYGWPEPQRFIDNNYRFFTEAQVAEILKVARAVRTGRRIGELIVNGEPAVESRSAVPPERAIADLREQVSELLACVLAPPGVYLSDLGRLQREAAIERVRRGRLSRCGPRMITG